MHTMAFNAIVFAMLHVHAIIRLTQAAQIPNLSHMLTDSIIEPTVQIKCMSGSMFITIKDPPTSPEDNLFSGMIYPKGLSMNSSCLTEYRHHDGPLKYKLPLRRCNTLPQETDDNGIEFFNTIVLQPHLKLVTELGRGYHVRCRYKSREAAAAPKQIAIASREEGIPDALIADNPNQSALTTDRREHGRSLGSVSNKIPLPGCHMRIYKENKDGKKEIAMDADIGNELMMVVSIDAQQEYGMRVEKCNVHDGLGSGEQNLLEHECPQDLEIMGLWNYSDNGTTAWVKYLAHRFAPTPIVYYDCPPNCSDGKRTKRDTSSFDEGQPATIEVYSGLYVNENAEIVEGNDDSVFAEKRPDDALCISQRSFAIAISIAGLVLMLCVVAAVLCILARRRSKTISNSGSSIYSGPYTNTAFSQSS